LSETTQPAPWPPTDPATVLACTAWMEDRSAGKDGMQAVMSVVLNRARSGITWWGSGIVGVCLAREQFSSWNGGSTQIPLVREAMNNGDADYAIALSLAGMALQDALPDTTRNSDSYFAADIAPPSWATSDKFTVEIGGQRYYRLYLSP
jgi:hypothetical protein